MNAKEAEAITDYISARIKHLQIVTLGGTNEEIDALEKESIIAFDLIFDCLENL